ncbi:MAG: glucose-6-phosphate isomerase [Bacilli bacterium]|nr:glucose-6-phosphate isomerase [Bacilli bacterium]
MIKFDFETYTKEFIDKEEYNKLLAEKEKYIEKLNKSNMVGWMREIDKETVVDIKETAEYIKNNFDVLVVIGIGGSYLSSSAIHSALKSYFSNDFEVIYAGSTLSTKYLDELLNYLKNKNFCLNVISKSGKTLETSIVYKLLKDLLKRKYNIEEMSKHIIATTTKGSGLLWEEAQVEGYKTFEIPNDVGGRYSFITPAHLLPLALNYDIDKIIDGYFDGKRLIDDAYKYALTRNLLFKSKKYIENFCVYEENLLQFTEWLKQLFGESEGKNNQGIFPVASLYTRDLHSLGQFIQEGNKIIFETVIKILNSNHYIQYNNYSLDELNKNISEAVSIAHYKGKVPIIEIEMDELTLENISELAYFFQLSAAFSGYLFNVNPFDQPGVELYKNEIKNLLNKG